MDADVRQDPLLTDTGTVQDVVADLGADEVASGGYDWDTAAKPAAFWGVAPTDLRLAAWNTKWTQVLALINEYEHRYRQWLARKRAGTLMYWPEPSNYTTASTRLAGAEGALNAVRPNSVQMKESIYYLKQSAREGRLTGHYDRSITTTKPAKDDYFLGIKDLIKHADQGKPALNTVKTQVESIRQTHLSPTHLGDIQSQDWYQIPQQGFQNPQNYEVVRDRTATQLATAVHAAL